MVKVIDNRGIALVAAVVVTLIVSLVAVAIATTAVSNRHLSISSYDSTSSYLNAQAGLNLGEVILTTAKTKELNERVGTGSDDDIAVAMSSECKKSENADISAVNPCFWWLGRDFSGFETMPGLSHDFFGFDNADVRFKVEHRDDKPINGVVTQNLGRRYFRVTSIGRGNGSGLSKIQGQVGVFGEVDQKPMISPR